MARLMRCLYCGLLQDEPAGVKECGRCSGELVFEDALPSGKLATYLRVQMELDQVTAPAGRNIDRHLLVTIGAPAQLPPEEAAPAGVRRPPLSFTAVLDVSGSMQGEKIAQAKEAVRQAITRLQEGDSFCLVTFSDDVHVVLPLLVIGEGARKQIESALGEIKAGGMTALDGGLEKGIEHAGGQPHETNLVLLLSDGQANVGETDLEKVGQRGLKARQGGLVVSTLGVGLDYNEALLAEIATQGGGRFYHVTQASQIPLYLTGELGEIAALAAREVQVHLTLPQHATLVPFSAAYPSQQDGAQALVTIGDLPRDTELEVPLRLTLTAREAGARESVEGTLSFRSPAGNALQSPLNRVTVRFVEQGRFRLQDGVVSPVVERVLTQMKAAGVLRMSRTMATRPQDAQRQAEVTVQGLRTYALLLGEERASKEVSHMQEGLGALHAGPAAAKRASAAAFRVQRGLKDYLKDK